MLNRTFIRLLALILVLSAVTCRLSGELPFLTGSTQDGRCLPGDFRPPVPQRG
jgi:hypothetical protein